MTSPQPPPRSMRLDIQALRAVAVALVVVYHLDRSLVPGGFVGVDAFFVISGFLITTMLIERPARRLGGLVDFWARRIRRLLPASLLVLVATLAGAWAFLPLTQWQATAVQARAAALYFVNWTLIGQAVDYLQAEQPPTAIQHFWSLAVEEQFYLGWPLLILLLTLLASPNRRRSAYLVGLGVAVIASFAYSVHLTATSPAVAYFSTLTRIWELGAGGLLAVVAPALRTRLAARPGAASAVATMGWALIATAGFTYTDKTPFPGWQAAVPVAGAAFVIAGHSTFRWYRLRPVHWLGDVSYSVYLWHWPLIVILPVAISRIVDGSPSRGRADDAAILVATLLLAGLSKKFVEDRFRTPQWSHRPRASYALGAFGMAVVVALATSLYANVDHQRETDRKDLERALVGDNPCLGAGAMSPMRHCAPSSAAPIPSPALAAKDFSDAYDRLPQGGNCLAKTPQFPIIACHFGSSTAPFKVALIGNSHAAHWLTALQSIGKERHWRITTYLAGICSGSYEPVALDTMSAARRCVAWSKRVPQLLRANPPDLVVVSAAPARLAWGHTTMTSSYPVFTAGFRRLLSDLAEMHRPVVVIRDTPVPIKGDKSVPDCVAEHSHHLSTCSSRRAQAISEDPLARAARTMTARNVHVVDLSDVFCTRMRCAGVVGGVIAYADGDHVTATFMHTVAPYLYAELQPAINQ